MKTRIMNMIDTETLTPLFGVQVKKTDKWAYLIVQNGDKNTIFTTPDRDEAEAKRRDLMLRAKAQERRG